MDFEDVEFYSRVRNAYLRMAEKEPKRFRVIDANGPLESIQASVVRIVTNFLGIS
jgi:dTMP kinase